MHYTSHILMHCIAFCYAINDGTAARSAVSPEILANFAKNVASVLSPALLGELQSRNNRSSLRNIFMVSTNPRVDELDSSSKLANVVNKVINTAIYDESHGKSYYNRIQRESPREQFYDSGRLETSPRDLNPNQEQPNFYTRPYRPYTLSPSRNDFKGSSGTVNIGSSIGTIEESPTNQYSSYHGASVPKAIGHDPFSGAKPYGVFHGFEPYGFQGYHYPHPNGYDAKQPSNGEAAPDGTARVENNGSNHRDYGPPYFRNHGYGQPYPSFPYGGYPNYDPYYGPDGKGENDTSTDQPNKHYDYGPYRDFGFHGPVNYGYNYNNVNRQADEADGNPDQNNSTKNSYPYPFGPPLIKPLLGTFHHHQGFLSPFNLPPYGHFHGTYKGGPVAGVGHGGYPIYADPYSIGFPFHHTYGPFYHNKHSKYLPPSSKGSDSGETDGNAETAAGELAEQNPERITALNDKEIASASNSIPYKTSK